MSSAKNRPFERFFAIFNGVEEILNFKNSIFLAQLYLRIGNADAFFYKKIEIYLMVDQFFAISPIASKKLILSASSLAIIPTLSTTTLSLRRYASPTLSPVFTGAFTLEGKSYLISYFALSSRATNLAIFLSTVSAISDCLPPDTESLISRFSPALSIISFEKFAKHNRTSHLPRHF